MTSTPQAPSIWSPSPALSPRVRRLRDEFFAFAEREHFRNEVRPYGSGVPWDAVWSPYHWGVVPEMYPLFDAIGDCLLAAAESVPLPDGFWKEPLVVRRALFFREVVERHLPVKILDGELIVGSYFNTALSKTHTKRESRQWRKGVKRWLREARRLNDAGVGNCGAVPGHLVPDYPKVLRLGFRGIAAGLEEMRGREPPGERRDLLRALIACCEAAIAFAARYADEAQRLAREEGDPARRAELEEIARICRQVPAGPATTFHEALQSLWFAHMLVMAAESYPGPGLSPGRIDQYLFPYYRADIDAGRLDRQQARELLRCFWIKHNYAYDYQGRIGNQGINSGFGQLVTLGGTNADGSDASNDLTWLMLDVIEEMNLLEPKPNIRLHANTPEPLLRRVAEMTARAQGSPFLLNFDEAAIRGLAWQGLPADQLWDYAPVGCLENTLQGCDRSGTVDVNLNLAKAVELALNDGRDMATGAQIGPRTGDPRSFADFGAFFDAFKRQLKSLLGQLVACNDQADALRARFEPTPYLSVLVDGCAESGRDVTSGGARHNYITVEGVALATTVDSLLAVKQVVFEDRRATMEELLAAIRANFDGYEALRQTLSNRAPKYGTDDPDADGLAREVSRFWTEEAFRHVSPATGKRYRGGYLSWNYWIGYAPLTAATPDGRRRGTYLSNGVCPVVGADREGLTAVIRSVGQLGLETAPNGASHTLTVSPSLLRDEEHVDKFVALLRAYCRVGGTALQINVIDPETLRNAQADPETYRNLLVRVTGYNAYFVTLGREIQDEIIAREAGRL
ncbi:MAG: pyruvate formate lyase family protein [Dehalococcoidia bacterium]|nr:pyruvate formate lyase family protein [Dehalococcoidia bacterium]